MSETRSYPRHVKTDGGDIEFRLMSRSDEAAVLAFAQKLPTHDLLFLPRNISQPKVLSAWINEIERGARPRPERRAGAVAGDLCTGARRRARKALGADDGRPAGGHRAVREPWLQGRSPSAGPRPGRRWQEARHRRARHNVAQVRAQMEAYGLPGAV